MKTFKISIHPIEHNYELLIIDVETDYKLFTLYVITDDPDCTEYNDLLGYINNPISKEITFDSNLNSNLKSLGIKGKLLKEIDYTLTTQYSMPRLNMTSYKTILVSLQFRKKDKLKPNEIERLAFLRYEKQYRELNESERNEMFNLE